MAEKRFTLNTEPHVAEIGDDILEFQPEVDGDAFMDAYADMREKYDKNGFTAGQDATDAAKASSEQVRAAKTALKEFLAELMLDDSALRYLGTLNKKTGQYEGGMKLPDRVHIELMHWVLELYGGRPTGPSSASAPGQSTPGTPSTGRSRSKGSTRARGRSAG